MACLLSLCCAWLVTRLTARMTGTIVVIQIQRLRDHTTSARKQLSTTHRKLLELKDCLVTCMIEMELVVEVSW